LLLRFRVSNFASLREEQELSLIALDEHPELAARPVPREGDSVLPVVGIFGKNASGKSNVIKAMTFAAGAVRDSHQRWLPEEGVPRWPFQLDEPSRRLPSNFVFDFVADDVRYQYGFGVNDKLVETEWLYSYPFGKKRMLFERDEALHFGDSLTGQRELIADLVRPNSLFLSAAAANNHKQLSVVHRWFATYRQTSPATSSPQPPLDLQDISDQVLQLLRYADLGISGARMVPSPDDEWERRRALLRKELVRFDLVEPDGVEPSPRLALVHDADTASGEATLPWRWESTGTQTWLYLVRSVLATLERGSLLVVDDLGTGLHPLLTAQLVKLFHEPAANRNGAQLVFNSHDVGMLGRHYGIRLSRDQVWLTEKDRHGATRLFPLTEFRVRDGLDDVEGRYLKGRYGAVPFLDDEYLSALVDTERDSA
jgi:hypothetical protein